MRAYDDAAAAIRAPLPASPDQRDLVRYATLAANSHNTQPWRFRLSDRRIEILPDLSRRTPVVDPDDHHLFTSLGCAAENLVIAAAARGQRATPRFEPADDGSVAIALEPAAAVETPAFKAIPVRQSTRSVYDGRPVPAADLSSLQAVAQSDMVDVLLITERTRIDAVMALVVEGNTAQFTDPAFVAELKSWIRFDRAEAVRDGRRPLRRRERQPEHPAVARAADLRLRRDRRRRRTPRPSNRSGARRHSRSSSARPPTARTGSKSAGATSALPSRRRRSD